MYLRIMTMATLMAASMHLSAQSIEKNFKEVGNGNPISGSVFCADPTALDYNGRLYVYGTNDHQEFIKNGKKGDNSYGSIKSLVVFSTDDMVNWTFHGTIDAQKLCSTWTGNPWYKGFMNSWAPSVVWRTNPDTGKDEFFLYFANTSHGVGVLTAESPIGPWKSPLKQSLINKDTPGALQQSANFDPGVVIDDNGTGWLTFGGLDYDKGGTDLLPGNTRIIKLKPSLTAIDGKAVDLPAPYHFEANELNIIGGKYIFTYCSNWAQRKDSDWNKYKKEKGISAAKPNSGTMCYMAADDPMDPDSWVYKGEYGPHPGSSGNNHSHLHYFQGNYYHIYHNGGLLEGMKSKNAIQNAGGYRSICVNKATVNEETQNISKVTLNNSGAIALKNLNPFVLQEAETMATCGGVMYDDFKNIKTNTKINTLGNDASENMYVKMKAGAWTLVRNADFGEDGAKSFMLRAKGTGKLEIRFTKTSEAVATMEFSSTDWEDHVIDIDPEVFNGKRNVFFIFTEAEKVLFDAWAFSKDTATGITPITPAKGQPRGLFDLNGHRLTDGTPYRGVVIEQYQDENGKMRSRKRVSTDAVH